MSTYDEHYLRLQIRELQKQLAERDRQIAILQSLVDANAKQPVAAMDD